MGHAVRLGRRRRNEVMPYDSGDDGAYEGMPYARATTARTRACRTTRATPARTRACRTGTSRTSATGGTDPLECRARPPTARALGRPQKIPRLSKNTLTLKKYLDSLGRPQKIPD